MELVEDAGAAAEDVPEEEVVVEDVDEGDAGGDLGQKILDPFRSTLFHECPDGLCAVIQRYNEFILGALVLIGLVFLATLVPPVFSWTRCKPDGKRRVAFAFLAFVTFYFWLVFLIVNSVYCFGFLAHEGPCVDVNRTSAAVAVARDDINATARAAGATSDVVVGGDVTPGEEEVTQVAADLQDSSSTARRRGLVASYVTEPLALGLTAALGGSGDGGNESCSTAATDHQADLRNLTCTNVLILVVLLVVLIANAKEGD